MINTKQVVNVEKLEELRKVKGYTINFIIDKLGYQNRTSYYQKLQGRRSFTIEDIVALSDLYNVSIDDLIIRPNKKSIKKPILSDSERQHIQDIRDKYYNKEK